MTNYIYIQEVTINKFLSEIVEHLAQGYTLTEESRYVPATAPSTIPLFAVKLIKLIKPQDFK
ncbi:hypothetical protein [Pseudomonas sp. NFACC05-1]|uniref:hypothetical protein n=1 Tax=Pseudomonas sp. NFACC05-1 TaxID=1566241 RepID=UPI0008717C3C|nr:hypothetical protein [Pseudomonas sp. NFACC05-1]SCW76274.1 hypothetical protein SAMN03159424_03009 [Pseudomonas sp. NFACC05-1]